MRNLPIVIGIAAVAAFAGRPLPICEEFAGEEHIQCVSSDKAAVIISHFDDGVQYEFYTVEGKGYIYLDGGVHVSTGKRHLDLASIPSENPDDYIRDVFDAVMDDIKWN